MDCTFCGRPKTAFGFVYQNGQMFCGDCWRERQASAGGVGTVTALAGNGTVKVTFGTGAVPVTAARASIGGTAPCTFTPVGCIPPATVALPQAEPGAPPGGSFIACARCQQMRPPEHKVTVSFGKMLPAAYCVCGPCLDALAEALYLNCAKRGLAHWRKKENRDA